ncbi:MAG: hypothetical protein LBF83_11015 [Spirochaetaceae bacterium]|nr:hypothetical protein [Spirochaetaceae bacterium]
MKKKKPRFFCDGCGTEVASNTDSCPRCGKFFASIRCPRCGFSGDADTFSRGCPACGYSAPLSNRAGSRQNRSPPPPPDSGATPWLYIVSIALLAALLTVLLTHITR